MLLFLDDYHLGDPLFLTGLAQDIARAKRPALLLHTGREAAATALEAEGVVDPAAVLGGDLGRHSAVVERAVRDENRAIAAALTEAGVSAVRLLASDRGLAQSSGIPVELGDTGWIATLLRQRTCVVVAALATSGDRPVLLDPAALALAIGDNLGVPVVVLATGRTPGLLVDGVVAEVFESKSLAARTDVPARAIGQRVAEEGGRVIVTSRGGAFDPQQARGTRISL